MDARPYRRLAVFGTPCGGTTHLAKLLRAHGLDVGKEGLRRDGCVCGFFVWGRELDKKHRKHKPMPEDYEWGQRWTLVRHPLRVAETLPRFAPRSNRFDWQVEDGVSHALRYWVQTMELALSITGTGHVVRVDSHFAADFERLRQSLELRAEPTKVVEDRNSKKGYRWPRLTWAQWRARDPAYAARAARVLAAVGLDEEIRAAS